MTVTLSRRALFIATAAVASVTGATGFAVGTATSGQNPAASDQEALQQIYDIAGARLTGTTTTTEVPTSTSTEPASSTTSSEPSTTTSESSTTTSSVAPTTSTSAPTSTLPATSSTTSPPSSTTTSTTVPPTTTTQPTSEMPNASNTGVPDGTALTAYTGSCNITTSNVVIDAKTISCALTITGSNVRLSRFRLTAGSYNAITVKGSGVVIEDGEIDCRGVDSYGINVTGGTGLMVRRVDISNCGNGIEPGNGTTFRDSFVHDLKGSSAEHVDGVSFDYGQDNVSIIHNTVDVTNSSPQAVSALMLTNYGGGCAGIIVTDNLWRGGGFTIYFEGQWSGAITVEFSRNRVAKGYHNAYDLKRGPVTVTGSGNVDATTGAAISF